MFGKNKHQAMPPELKKAMEVADGLLAERARIDAAVERGVEELQPLIRARLEAEDGLAHAEVQAALNDGRGDVTKAEQGVAQACSMLDRQSDKLGALRGRLAAQGVLLADAHQKLSEFLPGIFATARGKFAEEWAAGVAAFSSLLAKRRALEQVVGPLLDIPEPTPLAGGGDVDLGALDVVQSTQSALKDAMDLLVSMSKRAQDVIFTGNGLQEPRRYDPRLVYVAGSEFQNIERGTLLVDSSLWPGVLMRAVLAGYAKPYQPVAVEAGITACERRKDEIVKESEAEDKRRMEQENAARLLASKTHPRPDPNNARLFSGPVTQSEYISSFLAPTGDK